MYENYPNQYPYINPYSGMARQPQQVMSQPQPQNNTFVPVANIDEAKNYLVGYGNSVIFRDENLPMVFYTKTVNSQFEAPIFKIFDMVERKQEMPVNTPQNDKPMDLSAFVTKDEFGALQKELQVLKSALGEGEKV